ncbi:MAG: DUF2804 family protein, partial [Myxococcota bacterium]|nr:DUF2804 family protein [Myxococcota bacterium]
YMTRRPGPDTLVSDEGIYNGGWFENFDGAINPEDSIGSEGAFKGWLHFNLANDDYSVTGHLADLNTAGNAAIAVVDLATGESWTESTREAFGDNRMVIAEDFGEIVNDNDGSYLRVVDDGDSLELDIQAHDMHIVGTLQGTGADRYIQVTRYHDGYGILQWYEQVEVVELTVTLQDGSTLELPAGMRGTTDRMAGHRRTHQQWNWFAGAGTATRESDGETVQVAFSMTDDQDGARPQVPSQKYAVWIDGALHKVPSLEFTYTVLDPQTRETSDWVIASEEGDEDRVDLAFVPDVQRRDQAGYLWFYYTDYNAYCGELTGSVTLEGEVYTLDPMTVIAEDATLTL